MEIVVVGINHKNSPIEIREKVSFSKSDLEKAYAVIKKSEHVKEAVILSTCNRSEITAVVTDVNEGIQYLKDFYFDFFHVEKNVLDMYFFVKYSDQAVKHVFQLAAGLESLVLGEDQILGQVRNAHEYALEKGCTSKILNKLYREVITTAKRIKRETSISQNSLSISSIAVKLIEDIFDDLKDKKVLVIGVGKMSRIAIENLIYKGVKEIYVTNRTVGHAVDLSERYREIRVVEFKERYSMISKVDIIITSTSAPHYILKNEEFKKNFYNGHRLCIVDIAMPRDVDPQIKNIEGISVYELDELKKVSLENMESRLKAAQDAIKIIIEECIQFENWYNCIPVFPVIEEIQEQSFYILESEIESLMKRLDKASQKDKELIELVMRSMAKKLIKRPILNLKRAGEDRKGKLYAKIASELFGANIYSCRKKGRQQNA
ncbi:glutamyl-tRNA reductase [Crassaminicella indica]|uniref:Glutamyl-tRNA reductase n=1 Tax=Crassaminicella indica TaxID=2855394 RepID=A0ABX8R9C6_9CLOT|nr:glutamyl-tRNA reductase [Crassaminicella indica]QXM05655.1 glutamyl-tRNA reductase [Crassaminicella indica]